MKCYYEILKISQDASDDEIKKAFRKLALQLHPDKNPNNQDEAKKNFQEVGNAYEVLSDPQERAFYDRNRESILHGVEGECDGPKDDSLDLFKYFNSSCYSAFDDSETGFFTVYERVFESIAAKDMAYLDEDFPIPNFGSSKSDLKDVDTFYGYWQSYCTSMTFYWLDQLDIRQAQNRWVEKRVEKENKKHRDKGKKEFNEKVRSLVNFVRKRDKRWQAVKKQIEDKIEENKMKRDRKKQQNFEDRQKRLADSREEQKTNLDEYEDQLKAMESQFAAEWGMGTEGNTLEEETNNEESIYEALYCVACDKLFKSDKAFVNHENSRKHKDNQAALKSAMLTEEENFTGNPIEKSNKLSEDERDSEDPEDIKKDDHYCKTCDKILESNKKFINHINSPKHRESEIILEAEDHTDEFSPIGSADDLELLEPSIVKSLSKKSKKKKKNKSIVEEPLSNSKTSRKSRRFQLERDLINSHVGIIKESLSESDGNEIEDSRITDVPQIDKDTVITNGGDEDIPLVERKKHKKKKTEKIIKSDKNLSTDHICSVCISRFDSKNKLFTHLKTSGHATVTSSKSKR